MSAPMRDTTAGFQGRLLSSRQLIAFIGLALFLIGVKLVFIAHFGSAVPYWDQWDAEAAFLYKPYIEWGTVPQQLLFSAHNEHRIVLTRLLSLLLFELDGGWDPVLQMVVNAGLHVTAILILVSIAQRILQAEQMMLLVLFSAFVFLLPLGWENLLAGFQSQFYLLLIFSLLALNIFTVADGFSVKWWLALFFSVCAFFSMASGALIGAAAFCVVVLQMICSLRRGLREYAAAAVLLVVTGVMIAYVPRIVPHDVLKAHSLKDLVRAILLCVDYPGRNIWSGIWINLPLFAYVVYVLRNRPPLRSTHWIVFGIIVWWVGQIVSLAYGRAIAPTSSRYLDLIIVSLPLNFSILLMGYALAKRSWRPPVLGLTILWVFITVPGLIHVTMTSAFPSVAEREAQSREQQANVEKFLATNDIAALQGKPLLSVPYPSPERLGMLLSDPIIRTFLPDVIRPPSVDTKSTLDRTVLKGRLHPVVAALKTAALRNAGLMIGLGIALAFAATMLSRIGPVRSTETEEDVPPTITG
jgi:hypothetical protein